MRRRTIERNLCVLTLASLLTLGCAQTTDLNKPLSQFSESDVRLYVDKMYSDVPPHTIIRNDSRLFKWPVPIVVQVNWPECESSIGQFVRDLSKSSGIPMRYLSGATAESTSSIYVFGLHGAAGYANDPVFPAVLNTMAGYFDKNVVMDNILNSNLTQTWKVNYGEKLDVIVFDFTNTDSPPAANCKDMTRVLFGQIVDSTTSQNHNDINELDTLFLSALYQAPIQQGDEIETAKPVISQILFSKIRNLSNHGQ